MEKQFGSKLGVVICLFVALFSLVNVARNAINAPIADPLAEVDHA